MQEPETQYSWTLYRNDVISHFWEGSWDIAVQSLPPQINQTNRCLLHEAQTPILCTSGISVHNLHSFHLVMTACEDLYWCFFFMINKKKKKKLFSWRLQCIAWWMFYLDWGREKAMIGVPKNRTQFDWVQLISKKAQWRSKSPPFSLLISSFVWPLVFFFSPCSFKDVLLAALAQKQTFECSSHEGFGSLLSLQATRCWRPAPAEVEEEDWGGGGDLCVARDGSRCLGVATLHVCCFAATH